MQGDRWGSLATGTVAGLGALLVAASCSGGHFPPPDQAAGGPLDTDPRTTETAAPEEPDTLELLWSTEGIHFATAPVQVESTNSIVAYTAIDRGLTLMAFDPATGAERWRRPSTASKITPGVAFDLVQRRGRVFHIAPGPDGGHLVEAVDGTTGAVIWSTVESAEGFTDQVGPCDPSYDELCVTTDDEGIWRIDIDTGEVTDDTGAIVSLTRAGRSPRQEIEGRYLGAGLYDLLDSGDIARIEDGVVLWQKAPSELFGGADVDPDYGWFFREHDDLIIGTLRAARDLQAQGPVDLPPEQVAGIDAATGETRWLMPGEPFCGRLYYLRLVDDDSETWLRCITTGSYFVEDEQIASWTTQNIVEGFDPGTGVAQWSIDLGPSSAMHDDLGTLLRLGPDGFALVKDDGTAVGVDIGMGQTTEAGPETAGWCLHDNEYENSDSYSSRRIGDPFASPCNLGGTPQPVPAEADEDIGIVVDDVFVWMDEAGLHGARVP